MAQLQSTSITGTLSATGAVTLSNYGAGFVKFNASGAIVMDTNTYATTGSLSSYLALSGGTMTGVLTISTTEDGKLVLRAPAGDTSQWNYINFVGTDGVRDVYFGTDGSGNPTWYRDDNGLNITLGSTATINGTQIVTNSGTWGISITGNAATVGGYSVSTGVGANTVVVREGNGYVFLNYINSNVSESENPTINSFFTSNGDGYLRKSNLAHVRSQLGNYGNWITSSVTVPLSVSSASIGMDWWRDAGGTYMEFYGTSTATRVLRLQGSNGSGSYAQWYIDGGNQQIYGTVSGNTNFLFNSSTVYLRYNGGDRFWTGSDGTRNSGWAYHQDNNTGIHWPNNGWHFYPKDTWSIYARSGSSSESAIVLNTAGTNRGYVYANNSNEIGFLNNSGNWSLKTYSNGNALVYGYLTVNGAGTSSSIYMNDSDEGQREIHCNSNRIGFLTQAGSWGAWLYDGADWEAASSVRAPIFYDSNDTAYYGDFNGTSRFYQAIVFGDSSRYSGVSTTINGTGAGDKLILYGNASNYDARVLVGTDYDFIFKSQGSPSGKGMFRFYSGPSAALAMEIRADQNTYIAGTTYSYAYRGHSNVAGTGEASYHPAGIYSTGTNWLYGTMYLNGNDIYDVNSTRAYYYYDRSDTSYYLRPSTDSYLRSLYLGAHDSGTANFFFGEDSSGWYGMRWYWDSGYDFYWYGRNAGTDTLIMNYTTNSNSYVKWHRSFHLNGNSVDYVGSLYFSNGGHIQPNAGSYGALQMTSSKNGWAGIRFTEYNTNLMTNATTSGFHHNDYGWQFRWESGNAYVHSGTYGGGSVYTVLHSGNYTSWAQQRVYQGQSSGDWQNFTNDVGEFRVDEVLNITSGAHSNYPSGVYGYGGVMSWRTNNHSFQLYASHTGDLAYKTQWGNDNYSGWRTLIHSSNIGSQSVAYASNSGALNGWGYTSYAYRSSGSGYYQIDTWLQMNGSHGMYWPSYYGLHVYANTDGSYGSLQIGGSKNGWSGIYFNVSGDHLMANNNEVGHYQQGVGWKYRWYQGTMYISTGTTGGGSEYSVIHSGNIGSQSVSYASTAGNANSISAAVGGSYTWTAVNYFRTNQGGYCGSLDSGRLQIYSDSNNSAFFSFHKGGHYAVNMGLDADNVIRIGGWSASANRWQLDMSGNMTVAGDICAYSDKRVKENIITVENALDKVTKMRGVFYNRTDSDDKSRKVGVIAQEMLEVLPEVVNEDNAGMYNVSYGNIVGVLIEAIKEQQSTIDELKKQIKFLAENR